MTARQWLPIFGIDVRKVFKLNSNANFPFFSPFLHLLASVGFLKMMTEVAEEGLPCEEQQSNLSSDAPEDPAAAARSKDTEKRESVMEEPAPNTQERPPEPDKRPPGTQQPAPDTENPAPETEKRAPEPEQRAPVTEAAPSPMLAAPPAVEPSLLQYKLKKFFVLRVKHFRFPFHCHFTQTGNPLLGCQGCVLLTLGNSHNFTIKAKKTIPR